MPDTPKPTYLTRGWLRAADRLGKLGRTASAHALLQAAVAAGPDVENLPSLIAAATQALDFDLALRACQRLEDLAGGLDRCVADGLGATPITALYALERLGEKIGQPAADPVQPVEGRVAYIVHYSLPHIINGYATRGHGLARGMIAAGLDLICLSRPGFPLDVRPDLDPASLASPEQVDGIAYHRLLAGNGTQAIGPLAAARLIETQLRLHRPQVVMAASNYRTALPALIAARRCGLPFVYEVRGFWEITHSSVHPESASTAEVLLPVRIESELARQADHVFTLGAAMRAELERRGVTPERISLLPNGCDPQRFRPLARDEELAASLGIAPDLPVIGYAGSFNAYEGLDDLVKACGRLRAAGAEFRLLLVGSEGKTGGISEGPVTAAILAAAADSGLGDWLIMPGRVRHDKIEAFYSLIDIAPFPRHAVAVSELVSPLKPLEALAMEKAVIVSSVTPLAEMVSDGRTGLVFRAGDVAALHDGLLRLIEAPDLRRKLGRAARRRIMAERNWKKLGQNAAEVLRTVRALPPASVIPSAPPVPTIIPVAIIPPPAAGGMKRPGDYRVALIADEFTRNSFASEFHCIDIEPDNWREVFEVKKPDIFLCESAWSGPDSQRRPWQGKIYTSVNFKNENRGRLLAILHYCHQKGIPTIFWNKEDPTHYTDRVHDFVDTATRFDYVFTSAEECCTAYRRDYGVRNVHAMPFATNPRLFNPVETQRRSERAVFAGSWYANHVERSQDMDTIFRGLMACGHDLTIYDRYHGTTDVLHLWPEIYRPFLQPGRPHDQMPEVYKSSRIGVNFNTVTQSRTMFARRVFELMSSHTLVVSNYSRGVDEMFGELVIFADRDPGRLKALSDRDIDDLRERALNLVLSRHTYKQRWQDMLTRIGLPWQAEDQRLTMVWPVSAREDALAAIDYFRHTSEAGLADALLLLVRDEVADHDTDALYSEFNRFGITVMSLRHARTHPQRQTVQTPFFLRLDPQALPDVSWLQRARLHLGYMSDHPISPANHPAAQRQKYRLANGHDGETILGHAALFNAAVISIGKNASRVYYV